MEASVLRLEDVSEALYQLVRQSLETGLHSIEGNEDLVPVFNTPQSLVMVMTSLAEAQKTVRTWIQDGIYERGVLIYNGYITLPNEPRTRALMLDAYEHGDERVARFSHFYHPPQKGGLFRKARPLERIGRLKFHPGIKEMRYL